MQTLLSAWPAVVLLLPALVLVSAIVAQLTGKAPRWQAPLAQLGNALAAARPRG